MMHYSEERMEDFRHDAMEEMMADAEADRLEAEYDAQADMVEGIREWELAVVGR